MTKRNQESEIAVSGKTKDMGFLAAILREKGIPFRQSPTFSRSPVFCIPSSHEAQIEAILQENAGKRELQRISPEEVNSAREVFWVMVAAAVGILLITWARYFFRRYTR